MLGYRDLLSGFGDGWIRHYFRREVVTIDLTVDHQTGQDVLETKARFLGVRGHVPVADGINGTHVTFDLGDLIKSVTTMAHDFCHHIDVAMRQKTAGIFLDPSVMSSPGSLS